MVLYSQFIHVVCGSQTGSGHSDAVSINNKKEKYLLLVFFRGRDISRLFEPTY